MAPGKGKNKYLRIVVGSGPEREFADGHRAWCLACTGEGGSPSGLFHRGPGRERRAPDGGTGLIFLWGGVIESQEGEIWEEIRKELGKKCEVGT